MKPRQSKVQTGSNLDLCCCSGCSLWAVFISWSLLLSCDFFVPLKSQLCGVISFCVFVILLTYSWKRVVPLKKKKMKQTKKLLKSFIHSFRNLLLHKVQVFSCPSDLSPTPLLFVLINWYLLLLWFSFHSFLFIQWIICHHCYCCWYYYWYYFVKRK